MMRLALMLSLLAGTAQAAPETAYVAGGCFWCVEADFEKVKGVSEVISGYTGGTAENPTYKQVTNGGTGHYEAVEIRFDNAVVTYEQILMLFFRSVNPTDAGGQFCDRGDSYRTAIFADGPDQTAVAERVKAQAEQLLDKTVVTPILPAGQFWPAEDYHQDYYKGTNIVLTRFGPRQQATAYKLYREACGRDQRVQELWGPEAPFIGH